MDRDYNGDIVAPTEAPLSNPASQRPVYLSFEKLREEISRILEENTVVNAAVQKLETDISLYKRAYTSMEDECARLKAAKQEVEQQKEDLELKFKGRRVVILLDGDGAIFTPDMMNQGIQGGHLAAQKLSDSITQYLNSTDGSNHYQLYTYIFLNKRGLMDALSRAGPRFANAKVKLDEFMIGFNQAAERFMMVDVGGAKEAADAKIKALLEDDIKLPQTEKIIFGGCHDNGYVMTLRSQITAGFKHKLVLLPSYVEIAGGIGELGLPCINIPELFIPHKLGVYSPPQCASSVNSSPLIPAAGGPKGDGAISVHPKVTDFFEQTRDALPFAPGAGESDGDGQTQAPPPPQQSSYSSVLQILGKRHSTPGPDVDSSGSTSSDGSDDGSPSPKLRPIPTNNKMRRVNPRIPLSKHKPPPCTLFYLSTCKHGLQCKYGHDYELNEEHYAEIRQNARRSPCPSRNKGEICLWGEGCCYGHNCPLGTKCHYFKIGKCRFVGADMHRDRTEG